MQLSLLIKMDISSSTSSNVNHGLDQFKRSYITNHSEDDKWQEGRSGCHLGWANMSASSLCSWQQCFNVKHPKEKNRQSKMSNHRNDHVTKKSRILFDSKNRLIKHSFHSCNTLVKAKLEVRVWLTIRRGQQGKRTPLGQGQNWWNHVHTSMTLQCQMSHGQGQMITNGQWREVS